MWGGRPRRQKSSPGKALRPLPAGETGLDGNEFKVKWLMEKYDIQVRGGQREGAGEGVGGGGGGDRSRYSG